MNPRRKALSLALIGLSIAVCCLVIVAVAGIESTPYSTTDSAGRSMGFNDRLSPEHYWIMFSSFRVQALLDRDYLYSWFLLAMHACGAWLIVRQGDFGPRRIRRFFALQGLLFPLGWLGLIMLPSTIRSICSGTLEREDIIDVPFIALTAGPFWIATAMAVVCWCRTASTEAAPTIAGEPFVDYPSTSANRHEPAASNPPPAPGGG